MERRLVAILAADMVGYSRLMGADEEGTIARQKTHRSELIDPAIAEHDGRIVKTTGDGLLVEFPSVVNAVRCAVAIQQAMVEREADVAEERRIRYRVGVNLGDIVIDGDDILGDGVNVAARLEGLAEPGGICIPRKVFHEVRNKLDVGYEFIGEQTVKNIETPVPVYRVLLESDAAGKVIGERRPRRPLWQPGAVAAAMVAVVAVVWWQPWKPAVEPASVERMAFPLPDKPSIAVLPFTNMSDDASQEYFADGMTEDLITDLSKIAGLFVIARNSVFTYKGKAVQVRQVAEELGVRYVLEGSVRRVGDQFRINAQLIDATTGGHLWAERYDGSLNDVFALQDQVTERIVSALAVNLTPSDQNRRARSETASQEAYDAFLRGWAYYRRNTPEAFATAVPYLEKAVSLDPEYSRAHAVLSAVYWKAAEEKERAGHTGLWLAALGLGYEDGRRKGNEHLKKALEYPTPLALQVASHLQSIQGRHDEAIAQAERAIELDPNDPVGYEALAKALIFAGQPSKSVVPIRTAMRLDPNFSAPYRLWLGIAQFTQENFTGAAATLRTVLQRNPSDDVALVVLTAALGHLGDTQQAQSTYSELNDLRKKRQALFEQKATGVQAGIDSLLIGPYTLKDVDFWPFARSADRERLRHGLELAGVPAESGSSQSPISVDGATTVDAVAAKRLFDEGVVFVDVRSLEIWKLGHVPEAMLLDLKTDFTEDELVAVVAKDQSVVIYCEGPKCLRSSKACAKAVSWGFTRVHYLREGFPGWRAAGYPVAVE